MRQSSCSPKKAERRRVLVRNATPDKVLAELAGTGGKVLESSLSHDDEAKQPAALGAVNK